MAKIITMAWKHLIPCMTIHMSIKDICKVLHLGHNMVNNQHFIIVTYVQSISEEAEVLQPGQPVSNAVKVNQESCKHLQR